MELNTIVLGTFSILLSIVGFFVIRWIKEVDKGREKDNERMDDIENNYIAKFDKTNQKIDDVKETISKLNVDILTELNVMKINMSEKYVTKEMCTSWHKDGI